MSAATAVLRTCVDAALLCDAADSSASHAKGLESMHALPILALLETGCCPAGTLQATLAGRPGAAYVDIPSDVLFGDLSASAAPPLPPLPGPRPRPRAPAAPLQQAVHLLASAQR